MGMTKIAVGLVVAMCAAPGCFFFDEGSSDEALDSAEPAPPPPEPEPLLQEEPFEGECLPGEWIDAVDTLEAPGVPTTFDLRGAEVRITSDASPDVASMTAPMSLGLPGDPDAAIVVIENAVVDGEAVGTVVVQGTTIDVALGTIADIGIAGVGLDDAFVRAEPAAVVDDGTRPDLGSLADPAHVEALAQAAPFDLRLDALEISGFAAAWIVGDAGPIALETAFTVSAERVYWPQGTLVSAASMDARWSGELFIGLSPIGGELVAGGEPAEALPLSILGRDAHLSVGPGRVATLEPMPVRTAMDTDGALIGSEVEIRLCHAPTLVFSPGQTRALSMAYRQSDGLADAAFSDVSVDLADGVTMWASRVEVDGTLPAALTEPAMGHPECTWAQGLVGFFETWAEATAAIGRGVVCVFTFGFVCPDSGGSASQPPSLVPYPGWMDPGDVGEFQLELTAPTEIGTYEVRIHVRGTNYEAVVPATVVVR